MRWLVCAALLALSWPAAAQMVAPLTTSDGRIACIQGMAKARGRPVLTPVQVRNCLRSTGSPQQDAPGRPATQRIGNRPDLRAFATCAFGKGKELAKEVAKELKEGGMEPVAAAIKANAVS